MDRRIMLSELMGRLDALADGGLRRCSEAGNRDDRTVGGPRQTLHDTNTDTQTGEAPRPATEGNGIQCGKTKPRLTEQLPDPRQ